VWATVAPAAGGKPIDFSVSVEEACRQVLADPAGLRQILSNLLSNACRYTPAGGEISVRARCLPPRSAAAGVAAGEERGEVEIAVRDTGAGIPAQHLGRIFERFYRVDPARSRQEGGTGLGLAIVKHLVEAHCGRVSAESELGRGTTIRFTLPAAALLAEQQPSS
jgi:signal transduction histidine kinase